MSQWLYAELAAAGLPVICVEAHHMRSALAAQRNKTDRNEARGIAQMFRHAIQNKNSLPLRHSEGRYRVCITHQRAVSSRVGTAKYTLSTSRVLMDARHQMRSAHASLAWRMRPRAQPDRQQYDAPFSKLGTSSSTRSGGRRAAPKGAVAQRSLPPVAPPRRALGSKSKVTSRSSLAALALGPAGVQTGSNNPSGPRHAAADPFVASIFEEVA